MKGLRRLAKKFETLMAAEAFAEEGEFETAREIMREEEQPQKKVKKVTRDYRSNLAVHAAK